MQLAMRWVGEEEWDRVAEARLRCYAPAARDLEDYRQRLREDPRTKAGDCLLAELNGQAVGTATSHSLRMWVRGGAVPCQGVAWVGTIRTHRRGAAASGAASGAAGVATQVMREVLRRGRERGEVVSALMPFRVSFYEHFGYGVVERQCEWTLPLPVLPAGPFEGLRFYEPGDFEALVECRQRVGERGQCDIERDGRLWEAKLKRADEGFVIVDRRDAAGPVRGWMYLRHQHANGKDTARVVECGYEDVAALRRQLHFLASLRDQYSTAIVFLPADLPLDRLLREPQITHRSSDNHPTPQARPFTRMQVRVLDHKRFLEALRLSPDTRGRATVAVQEVEGHESRIRIDASDGRVAASDSAESPALTCPDRVWAAVASGDLSATKAAQLGLAEISDPGALRLLDAFSVGPAPFTHEYF